MLYCTEFALKSLSFRTKQNPHRATVTKTQKAVNNRLIGLKYSILFPTPRSIINASAKAKFKKNRGRIQQPEERQLGPFWVTSAIQGIHRELARKAQALR